MPQHGQASPGLPSLTFLEFYSFLFFEVLFHVLIFYCFSR